LNLEVTRDAIKNETYAVAPPTTAAIGTPRSKLVAVVPMPMPTIVPKETAKANDDLWCLSTVLGIINSFCVEEYRLFVGKERILDADLRGAVIDEWDDDSHHRSIA
jgi:hypothetical protein